MTPFANLGRARLARGLPPALSRMVAVLLFGWMALSTVLTSLTACCGDAQPCCAAALSGQGCPGCSTAVVIPVDALPVSHGAGPAIYSDRSEAMHGHEVPPPWTPPD